MRIKLLIGIIILCGNANAQYIKLFDFNDTTNGSYPWGSFISDSTFLYGMTSSYNGSGTGTVFKIKFDGSSYTQLHDFGSIANDGHSPNGKLLPDGTMLYGMTVWGGINDAGAIFKIKPDGSSYSRIYDFGDVNDGRQPYGSLISDGTFLYGMTRYGGTNNFGILFKILPDGTAYSKLLDFDDTFNGKSPYGSLIYEGAFLYGMTSEGGTNNGGTIFKIKPDGSSYSKLLDFGSVSGGGHAPSGTLISDGTFLYGMTSLGGANTTGAVFKIKPDGTGYITLFDFDMTSGYYPSGSLLFDGTFLYGMTQVGGANGSGTLFEIKPDGSSFYKLLDFDAMSTGPQGDIITDGSFLYGMTGAGGANYFGTIFKFGLAITNILENKTKTDFTIYPNPFSSSTILQTNKVFKDATLAIYNSFGQEVKQMKNISGHAITLQRENLKSGLYFIRITQDNKTYTADKIIITDN